MLSMLGAFLFFIITAHLESVHYSDRLMQYILLLAYEQVGGYENINLNPLASKNVSTNLSRARVVVQFVNLFNYNRSNKWKKLTM